MIMKKIFTLIAVTLMAITASAKEEVPLFTPWEGGGVTVDGTTFTLPGGWQGAATNYTFGENDDKTAYEYVYIKYTGATGTPNFGIVYNEWVKTESWGEAFATVTTPIPDGDGVVFIKLDKESVMKYGNAKEGGQGIGDVYAKHVSAVQIQSGTAPASLTVVGVWFGTKAECAADGGDLPVRPAPGESLVIWKGNHVYGSSWSDTDVFDAKYFDVAEVGDVIRCNITDANNPNPVFKNVSDWSDLTDIQNTRVIKETYFEGTIATAEALENLKKNGLRLQGVNFTLTSVELIAKIDYQETGKAIAFNEEGFIAASEFDGLSDNAKVVFTIDVKGDPASYIGWGIGRVSSNDATETSDPTVMLAQFSIIAAGEATASALVSDIKKALVATPDGISFVVWGFDDNKCYAERVKVEAFEVAGTGVEVVKTAAPQSNVRYNLAGQRVSDSYKGVVIINGKKVMMK